MQSLLMAASAAALLHSTMVTSDPLITDRASPGPMPQNGVWALLPDQCERPTSLDMTSWAKCATPIGFQDTEVAALEKPSPGKKATPDEFFSVARTRFVMAGGEPALDQGTIGPAIAQVVVPMVFSRSYYYLAILPKALDDTGHFAEARGWPVACAPKDHGGCTPKGIGEVYDQAAHEPTDPQRLYRLVRILPSTDPVPGAPTPPSTPPAPAPGEVTSSPLAPPIPPAPVISPN